MRGLYHKCAKKCPFEAIDGELKRPHVVDADKCAGCGVCAATCRKEADYPGGPQAVRCNGDPCARRAQGGC